MLGIVKNLVTEVRKSIVIHLWTTKTGHLELTFGFSNRADKIHNCGVKNSFNLIIMIAIKQNAAVCKTW